MKDSDGKLARAGARMRYVRGLLDMTQQEVAARTGLTKACVSRVELGRGASAAALLALLEFYSEYVRTDMMLSDRLWEAALMEGDLMLKNKAVSSVIEAKLNASEKAMLSSLQKTRNDMVRSLENLQRKIRRSMLSAKSLLD